MGGEWEQAEREEIQHRNYLHIGTTYSVGSLKETHRRFGKSRARGSKEPLLGQKEQEKKEREM